MSDKLPVSDKATRTDGDGTDVPVDDVDHSRDAITSPTHENPRSDVPQRKPRLPRAHPRPTPAAPPEAVTVGSEDYLRPDALFESDVSDQAATEKPADEAGPIGSASPMRTTPGAESGPPTVDSAGVGGGVAATAPTVHPRVRKTVPAHETVLTMGGLVKRFGDTVAVDDVSLEVTAGTFYGIVGPNGAGKTTMLSMITGLLRPDAGVIRVHGVDVWADPARAKRSLGVLPDRLRLFDRLTGVQLLHYAGVLRGMSAATVRSRSADLIEALALEDAAHRLVSDYSTGMTKKIALAAAMIHAPRILVLDEPFESVDPVSAVNVTEILRKYVEAGGTVVLSSHGMDLIERICDSVAIIVAGRVLAAGTVSQVRAGGTLEDRFVDLAGGRRDAGGLEWLHSFSG